MSWILKKILGSKNPRESKRLQPIVRSINAFNKQFKVLSDDELRAKTAACKAEFSAIDDPDALARRQGEISPKAFAVLKNAARFLTKRAQLEVMHMLSIEQAGRRMEERLSQICREYAILEPPPIL